MAGLMDYPLDIFGVNKNKLTDEETIHITFSLNLFSIYSTLQLHSVH